jgi:integrase
MAFVTDKETLKPGLIIFRRGDVAHRDWYCRVKLPKADRYKTISLKTPDLTAARDRAFDHDADVRFRLKHDVPVFNRPFRDVAKEYLAVQQERAAHGEISAERPKKIKAVIDGSLDGYIGATQVHLVGLETWEGYPAYRRAHGEGRYRDKVISDNTIRFEMSILRSVMSYAVKKRYAPASLRFESKPKLKVMRRDEFSIEEYRHLHTTARRWVKEASRPSSLWYRTVAYAFVLIMCNTGMRPSEAKNLRWGDIAPAKDRDGKDIVILFVQGKGKSRKLVAPASVAEYFDRIRAIARTPSKTTAGAVIVGKPDINDPVFTTHTGAPAKTLYQNMIEDLLVRAKLREGVNGIPRSTYCFRHTYATLRLSEGVDVYFLAEQMGTSVKMIEDHYGHVNTVRHADRVLQGMGGWDPKEASDAKAEADAQDAKAAATREKARSPKTRH